MKHYDLDRDPVALGQLYAELAARDAEIIALRSRLNEAIERDRKGDEIIHDLTIKSDRHALELKAASDAWHEQEERLHALENRLGHLLSRLIERDNGYDRCVICCHQTHMGQDIPHDTDCPLYEEPSK